MYGHYVNSLLFWALATNFPGRLNNSVESIVNDRKKTKSILYYYSTKLFFHFFPNNNWSP